MMIIIKNQCFLLVRVDWKGFPHSPSWLIIYLSAMLNLFLFFIVVVVVVVVFSGHISRVIASCMSASQTADCPILQSASEAVELPRKELCGFRCRLEDGAVGDLGGSSWPPAHKSIPPRA